MSRRIFSSAFALPVFLFFLRPPLGTATLSVGYTPEKTCFSVKYHGELSNYRLTPLFVLPGEDVTIEIEAADADEFEISNVILSEVKDLKQSEKQILRSHALSPNDVASWKRGSPRVWNWNAPRKTGFYPATLTEKRSGESMSLQIFVMVPYGKLQSETLNGYRIGRYPKVPPEKLWTYSPPRGFIEVTPENKNALLSPHFKLGQFLCKQEGRYPKYVVLREKLLLKLECLLEHVNAEGISCRTFSVMSGYRTPYYNRCLRNVKYSRHMWGDAADIFITNDPNDNYMADLNGDGKRDYKDAEILYQMVNELQDKPSFREFIGGLGWYRSTRTHGPFVHVDARGIPAEWNN